MTVPEPYEGADVLVTGGLGFIGSTLAIALSRAGAHVTILDAMVEGHGGNLFNIEPVRDRVTLVVGDIRDTRIVGALVPGRDFIFHLAGQNDHVLSLTDPFPDIEINIKGSAVLLEALRRTNREAVVVYTGTRGEYGPAVSLPVGEDAPLNPRGIYELSSLTAQRLFRIYNDNHGVRSVTLRLTNIYGPRAQMRHDRFGVANWFVRIAMDGGTIPVFGDGSILRDFLYVDDTVEAIMGVAREPRALGQTLNVGSDVPASFLELASTVVEEAGCGSYELAPFTPERAALEPGDFYSDISKIRATTGWRPRTSLREGVRRTIDYYRAYKGQYWE